MLQGEVSGERTRPRRVPACNFRRPRCGNVPLTRTPNTTREDAYAPWTYGKPWLHCAVFGNDL